MSEEGRCEEAIRFYKLNLDLYAQGYYTHRTYNYLGHCFEELDRIEEAVHSYGRSLSFNPNNKQAEFRLNELRKKFDIR